jgi:4-methyl-5(b-hydroxyethyl)-thiazole monophosphate biosynthesis
MSGYIIENKGIVIDGKLITGSGAGHSLDFSLTIAQILTDKETVALLNSKLELV